MHKYASEEERAAKNQKTTVRHFGFTEKVYGLPCTFRTMLVWKRHHRNAIVRISFFTGRHTGPEAEEREKLIMTMREKVEWQSMEDDERVAAVLSYACRDDGVGRGVEKMWRMRFFDRSLIVPAPPPPPLIPNV